MNYCTAVAAGVTTFIANEVAKCMFVPLKPHIDYIRNRNKNLEEFKKKIDLLKDERGRVKNAVDAAERNGEKIEEGVNKWLISVDEKINDEAEKVKALEDKAKKRCFIGLCPNLKSYYQLGKKVEEDARVVAELLEQGRFDRVSYRLALEGIGTMPVKDYEAFESRTSTLAGIMEAIRDPKVGMIGVHGMAGVGKTTLVKEVARKVREESLFDEVVMATISHNPNIRNIQGEIADMLGLRFDQEAETGRAMRLRQCFELRNDKKILVILDDIWERFDLEAIGIWFEEDGNRAVDEKQGAMMQNIGRSSFNKFSTVRKILLTSRSQDVLGHMKSERKFEIRILSQEEAMALFTKIVGDTVEKPDFRSIAKQVVDKTDGLPVAISVIAKALKEKGLDIWEDALRQLGSSTPTNIEGMQKGVYSIIELSYNSLESEEARSLLQLCSWRPLGSRIYVPYLLRSSLGLDLLGDVKTLKEARNSLNTLLDKLKASGLLHEGDSNGYVKMHDLVRNVCILITSGDEQIIVTEEADLKELLKKRKLKNCKGINLVYSEIHELPYTLECPKLKFLAMWSEDPLSEVSDNFFIEMKELKVLQLGGMGFSSLPKSFVSLTNLQTLFLDDCKLHNIAIIGELKKLDILTLNGSRIEQLPREIGQLTHLRLLDLTDCSKLVVIPENVISSLTCLEELYMGNSFDRWDVEGNARLAELKDLCYLTTLDVQIRDAQILRGDLLSGKLKRYKIFLGDGWDWSAEHGYSRTLKLKLNTSFNLDDGITMLLKNSEDLYVDELKGVSSVLYDLDKTGFPDLKSLHVQNNSEIQCIIDSSDRIAFPILESLYLHSLVNLRKICGEVDVGSFAGLRIVKVGNCNTLENLFSFSLAITLSQLQEIEVIDCTKVIGIVTAEREQSNKASNQFGLRQLRSLTLQRLPELISFCSEEKKHSTSQPGLINTRSLPLFTEKMLFRYLENLRLSSMNIESIWHNQLFKLSSSVQNLTSLMIENCDNLKHLLSSTMARSLVNLKSFEIIKCKSLREIICTEDTEDDKATISFPQLNSLKLKDLQYLIGFCSETHIVEFPTLKLLEIDNCLELKGFMYKSTIQEHFSTQAFFNEKVAFPCLEKMTISRLRKMKIIWHNQLFVNSFSKLEEVTVEHCNELLTFFPSNFLGTFQRLHTLTVSNCGSLEQVFELQTLSMEKTHVVASKLRELNISRLPRLRYIWCTKDPQGIFTFENLRILDVDNCRSLKNVFPASVARVLPQLKDLRVAYCGVEEIISKDEGLETAITFEFDQVSSLILWDLPKLKCFYPGMHKTTWRMLKELKAYHCNKLKIFGTERLNLRDMNEDGHLFESPIQPPLFSVEKVIPKLEELALDGNDIEAICDTQASRSLFHEIKALSVHCYHDEYAIFPITFLERFYNLEWLEVICCNFKELFSYKGDVNEEIQVGTYSRIRKLKLAFLHNLQYLWGKDSRISQILPNLENLEVLSCDNLITLGLFSASFTNLKILDVWGCYALINLVASSAAQSLVHLEKMVVTECVSVKEIVGNEGDEQTYNIAFAKLKCLELQHLPNLTSFSSSNHTFEFPSLEEVIVSQCPELKIFSRGNLNVPMLRRVQVKGQDYKVGYQGMVYLVLSKFSMSREIWSHNLQRNLDFKSLKLLRVYDCHGLKFIFTVSMALDLLQLEEITVKNCPAMEQIIINDGVEQRAVTDTIMFPWLKFITLESCTNLTSFLRGSNTMECPLLKQIIIADCPKMIAFASTFLREQDIETVGEGNLTMLGIAQFFSDQVSLFSSYV
ncbi:uncharacterized protein LOC111277438 [Durio zibethinus]|uniref:Uncharacterized protein LOC111277438 n=1 Tax=Durio zibethinus TaxID=66656 RepID=A0A6P5WVU1_DURZI|nr:uncharacterized protein LOC111277438 [Durio zibethinus]